MPSIEISQEEQKIWQDLLENRVDIEETCFQLNSLRDGYVSLSTRSIELLTYEKESEKIAFLESVISSPLIQIPCITCLGVIQKDIEIETGCSMLIVGTENKFVYILDQVGSSIIKKILLPSVPVFICSLGL